MQPGKQLWLPVSLSIRLSWPLGYRISLSPTWWIFIYAKFNIFKRTHKTKHPIKYNSMVIKHLPRDSGSQTARKPELLPQCPLTRDIVFARGLLLLLFNVLCRIKIAPIGVSTVLGKSWDVLCSWLLPGVRQIYFVNWHYPVGNGSVH